MHKHSKSHAWTMATSNNLRVGRKKGFRFQPYGYRSGDVRPRDLGLESRFDTGHRVIRSNDIGQQWMRTQAAIDYSFEIWRKLLAPIDYNTTAVSIVEEE